ncbi:BTB/POZ domain-containing protein 6-B-like [Paramacrobiotus metropolitanus]|uniref:BTB/POZ domain-containing protein 6-B-like n=1 Tax=Paramacrobiotus metropolitanus TaxID=2943436 RepID=UPI002445A754|nr:BTB/POZ domain-containing protein 6-B-like [Paramacrobiotus metropolitanus]
MNIAQPCSRCINMDGTTNCSPEDFISVDAYSGSIHRRRPNRELVNCISRSLTSGDLSDVQFTVGGQYGPGKTFSAHKYVLCLRSSVFAGIFHKNLSEKIEQPIDIPDVMPAAFANMLRFLYTDTVYELYVDNVCQTLACAEKYNVQPLVKTCVTFIRARLRADNCLTILENIGAYSHAEKIVKRCWELIDRCATRVLESQHFTSIKQETLVTILQRDTLCVGENDVYLAVERWALTACGTHNLGPSTANRRQMLGDALFNVRFPLLTNAQLAKGPVKSRLLLPAEAEALYKYKSAKKKPPLPFLAQPRISSFHRIANTVYQHREKVFVKISKGRPVWGPAEIIGTRPRQFLFEWRSSMRDGNDAAAGTKIMRASDVLKPGQPLFAVMWPGYFRPSRYRRARKNQHVVYCEDQEHTLGLKWLMLQDDQMRALRARIALQGKKAKTSA